MSAKPTRCPKCKDMFPSRAAMWRHVHARCCIDPTHISCSECNPRLKALAQVVGKALRP